MTAPLKLLLTGEPGCGKTTAIRGVVERLRGRVAMTGFVTEEIRAGDRRKGFRGVTLDGRAFPLAETGFESALAVGPYKVVLDGLESVGLEALTPAPDSGLVVLDEIGRMESFSDRFRRRVEALLAGPTPLLATVALHGLGFPKSVRSHPAVATIRMSRASRFAIVDDIVRRLERAGVAPPAPRRPRR